MAVSAGQATLNSTTAQFICDVPTGATVYLTSVQTSANIFLGLSASVTATNGCPLGNTGPMILTNPTPSGQFALYGITSSGSDTVGYFVIRI